MPIINGACVPAMCIHVRWDATKAALVYKKNKKVAPPPAVPPAVTMAMNGAIPGVTSFKGFLKTLVPYDLDCDTDCQCNAPKNWPWVVVPDQLIYDDQTTGWQVYVTGVKAQVKVSPCSPKPAKANGKKTGSAKSDPGKKGKKPKKAKKSKKEKKKSKK